MKMEWEQLQKDPEALDAQIKAQIEILEKIDNKALDIMSSEAALGHRPAGESGTDDVVDKMLFG